MALSDGPILDAQAGAETFGSALIAALAGVNSVSGPGMLDFLLVFSLPKLVFDDEMCGQALRFVREVEPHDDLPVDELIDQLMADQHLIMASHTTAHWPTELYLPSAIVDRDNREAWMRQGSKDAYQRACEEVDRRLAAYRQLETDPAIDAELRRIIRSGLVDQEDLPVIPVAPEPVVASGSGNGRPTAQSPSRAARRELIRSAMDERAFGTTGLRVSRLGLGLAAVGRPAYINLGRATDLAGSRGVEELRQRSHELLDAAMAAGVRYVDVARSYGLAESFLGSWLDARPPDAPVPTIGSKWGYTYVADWRLDAGVNEVKDHSLAAFRRQLAETRSILGSRLALYQVHSATLESGILDDRAVLRALAELAAEGVAVGLSVSGPRQAEVVRRALEIRLDGRNPFSSVQATWNLLEPSVEPALAEAHDAGWGVIVKEALANGRLAQRGSSPEALAAIAVRRSVQPDAVAIAAVLARPWADVALSGAATVDQLHANLAALAIDLRPEELLELAACQEPADAYWAARSRLAWT